MSGWLRPLPGICAEYAPKFRQHRRWSSSRRASPAPGLSEIARSLLGVEPGDAKPRSHRNPDWERDELILACDLTREADWRWLPANDPRVIDLSRLLQRLPLIPPEQRDEKFRNPNGVARKTSNIATWHPDYSGKPTNGGALDREVLNDFLQRPDEMRAAAEAIRAGVLSPTPAKSSVWERPAIVSVAPWNVRVPFGLSCFSLITVWCGLHGHAPDDIATHRARARWYTTETEPAYDDMTIKLRRVIIAARFRSPCPDQVTPEETRAVLVAWAAAGT